MGGDPAAASALGAGIDENVAAQLGLLQHLKQNYPQLAPHLSPEAVLQQLTSGDHQTPIGTRTKAQGMQKLVFPGQTTTIVHPSGNGGGGHHSGHNGAPIVQVIHVPVTSSGGMPQPVYKPSQGTHFLGMQAYESKHSGSAPVDSPIMSSSETNSGYTDANSNTSGEQYYNNATRINDRPPPPGPQEDDEEDEEDEGSFEQAVLK